MIIDYNYFITGMTAIPHINDSSDDALSDVAVEIQDKLNFYIRNFEPRFLKMLGMSDVEAEKHLTNDNNESIIASYVYFMYVRDNAMDFISTDNAYTNSSITRRLISCWNLMVDNCRQLALDGKANPPSIDAEIFHYVNPFNL